MLLQFLQKVRDLQELHHRRDARLGKLCHGQKGARIYLTLMPTSVHVSALDVGVPLLTVPPPAAAADAGNVFVSSNR